MFRRCILNHGPIIPIVSLYPRLRCLACSGHRELSGIRNRRILLYDPLPRSEFRGRASRGQSSSTSDMVWFHTIRLAYFTWTLWNKTADCKSRRNKDKIQLILTVHGLGFKVSHQTRNAEARPHTLICLSNIFTRADRFVLLVAVTLLLSGVQGSESRMTSCSNSGPFKPPFCPVWSSCFLM